MTWQTMLFCVGMTLAVFVFGLFMGASLTYKSERGINPIPMTGGRAIIRRLSMFGKRGKKEENDDKSQRWTA